MEDLLIEILSQFGYPVRRQGSFLENEKYPDHFFTFWNLSSDASGFYDNDQHLIQYEYNVNFYSVDADMVYTVLREARRRLRNNGFDAWGDAHDVISDKSTHDGRGITVSYLKEE